MSSEMTFEYMKLAIEEKKDLRMPNLLRRLRALEELLIWVNDYSSMLCGDECIFAACLLNVFA